MQSTGFTSRAGALATLAVSVALGVILACSGPHAAPRREPPAPDFEDLPVADESIRSAMGRLAVGVRSLQAIFDDPAPLTPSQRLEVIGILDQMIVAADELGPEDASSSHPRITDHLGRFREKLAIAREAAAMSPPRYYLVGNLAGTCLACHSNR